HMVDDKMHARSIGPYSLITQQPLISVANSIQDPLKGMILAEYSLVPLA
ncbi:MAG TPA: hypothetical protein EYN28_02300, partial [Flavobacteriales bacterium]|nr:hypothetical protein [Flavobacteriales bacterium]